MNAAKIHRELCAAVYGQNVMNEGTLRQWRRMFKDGCRTNVHDEERSGRPAICNEWWSCLKCWLKFCERRNFQNFHANFRKFHLLLLYEIIRIMLGYHKFCSIWVPKMFTGVNKTQKMAPASTFFTVILQRWRWVSQSHRKRNRWWNVGFICEYWDQRAVKSLDAHTFTQQTRQKSLNKRCLPESW
jgi:hypothetical protein